jgi:ornithine carbamoyltransferase
VAKTIGGAHDTLDRTTSQAAADERGDRGVANKLARIAWAIMIREDRYNPVRAFAAVG